MREFLKRLLGPSASEKEEEWYELVAEAVRELETRLPRLTTEVLSESPTFGRAVSDASRIALRTRDNEKLQALLNAIQNSALPDPPGGAVQFFFLRFVDELTPVHLQVLTLLNDPREWLRTHGIAEDTFRFSTIESFVGTCMPAMGGRAEMCGRIFRTLQARGLVQQHRAGALMTHDGLLAPRTTAMGRQFLQYIAKPRLEESSSASGPPPAEASVPPAETATTQNAAANGSTSDR